MVKVFTDSYFNSTTNIIIPDGSRFVWLVDCGEDENVLNFVREKNFTIEGILLTHGHFDHIFGLNTIMRNFPEAKVYTSESGSKIIGDSRKNMSYYWGNPLVFTFPDSVIIVKDGDEVSLDNNLTAKAIYTPGHNPSCITWVVGDAVFTGDAYIPGVKIVTNLPGGNKIQAEESLSLIHSLSAGRTIFPGHII